MHKRSTFRSAPPFFVPLLKLELLFIQTVVAQCKLSTPLQLSSGTGNNQITQISKSPSRIISRSEQDEHSCSRSSRSCACSRYQGGSKRAMQSPNHIQLPHSSLLSSISVTPSKMPFAMTWVFLSTPTGGKPLMTE